MNHRLIAVIKKDISKEKTILKRIENIEKSSSNGNFTNNFLNLKKKHTKKLNSFNNELTKSRISKIIGIVLVKTLR